ncbi:acetyl-CoA synthetase [Candidatus Bathyarchaeota archaeon]|jgi:acyl-CoA synthetase (NDP forming)|nr:acetyl-CoA synthetase [Candidatus Bathyarchaeota archaeon]MDP6048198.1 acetate--CoA ligase family protein [Candidatus Bathyarchaeota archaeon]MDP7207764.1 acetate--CoA ligase family protein [Candidatus Bathyarchaeota archaeon]|tara:strand:+ start:551 stop:1249 length:699 start_codon:yes stop_codon:yes gene_type:complete
MRDKAVNEIFKTAEAEGRDFLFEHEAKNLCVLYGLPVTKITVGETEEDVVDAAKKLGFPVVLKIVSPQVIHKSDVGGVLIDIKDEMGVRQGYKTILKNIKAYVPEAEITGILIQKMAPWGTEVIVGSTKDPTFGTTLMFGLGGIFVEILKDVSFRLVPIVRSDAEEMVKKIKAYKILEGVRGKPPSDTKVIVEILLKTSEMLVDCPEISELDMNPVLVYEEGAMVVDARIIL